jgi:hypothetical protein
MVVQIGVPDIPKQMSVNEVVLRMAELETAEIAQLKALAKDTREAMTLRNVNSEAER